MGNRTRDHDARMLELLALDAYPAPGLPSPAAVAGRAPAADTRAVREAYFRARFPGVIRSLADLDDALRVADALHCYALDGREDRAAELRLVAGAAPEPAPAHPRTGHAARLHRKLAAWTSR